MSSPTALLLSALLGAQPWPPAAQEPAGETAASAPLEQPTRQHAAARILQRSCLPCHGSLAPEAGVSLATREGLLDAGRGTAIVVPGAPAAGLLMEVVQGDPPRMPRGGRPALDADEVQALQDWIAAGAPWPEGLVLESAPDAAEPAETWWSARPLVAPPVPVPASLAEHGHWGDHEVDAFVLARLEAAGLQPSPPADRRTLIRRVSFDLTGLPPTPEQVEDFVADPRPDAYERLVDALLESPRSAERWARHWLDVVHFGETHGFDKDKMRPHAWPYRDWVIEALQQDLPWADFVRMQIAGDVLWPDDPRGVVATGMLSAGPWDFVGQVELREGTRDKKITRVLDRDDMLATVFTAFASTTLHCARCHDHKFDPVSQRDYYAMQAVFAGVDRADREYDPDPDVHRRRRELQEDIARLQPREEQLAALLAAQDGEEIRRLHEQVEALTTQIAALPEDDGTSPTNGWHSQIFATPEVSQWVEVDLGSAQPVDRIVLDPARPVDFPDTPGFGFPVRYLVEVWGEDGAQSPAEGRVAVDHRDANVPNPGDVSVEIPLDGRPVRRLRITATRLWQRTADYVFALGELQAFVGDQNVALGREVRSLTSIESGRWSTRHLVDGYDSRTALLPEGEFAERLARRQALQARLEQREAQERQARRAALPAPQRTEQAELHTRLAALRAALAELPAPSRVYAATPDFAASGQFAAAGSPRPVFLLHRGDVDQPGEEMLPAPPSAWPELASCFEGRDFREEGARRAALAEWMVHPQNPLSWRSVVNRVWQHHFGRGLVTTPNDFGRMGATPSHPELLDHLAITFRDGGGSLRDLHRRLLTSATYRQSSAPRDEGLAADAGNRLLWRAHRRRLEAEALRDSVLAISGRLDLRMGGPSDQWFEVEQDHSPRYLYDRFDPSEGRRRSVYRFVVRSVPDPFMECLDCPDPSRLTAQRNTTLTALQSLALLNDPFMLAHARHFAQSLRDATPGGDEAAWIELAFRRALCRPPTDDESRLLLPYLREHGLENLCRLVFNLSEFHFVD